MALYVNLISECVRSNAVSLWWGVGAPDEMMIVASMVTGREASAKRNGLHERLPIIVESPYDVPQSLAH